MCYVHRAGRFSVPQQLSGRTTRERYHGFSLSTQCSILDGEPKESELGKPPLALRSAGRWRSRVSECLVQNHQIWQDTDRGRRRAVLIPEGLLSSQACTFSDLVWGDWSPTSQRECVHSLFVAPGRSRQPTRFPGARGRGAVLVVDTLNKSTASNAYLPSHVPEFETSIRKVTSPGRVKLVTDVKNSLSPRRHDYPCRCFRHPSSVTIKYYPHREHTILLWIGYRG